MITSTLNTIHEQLLHHTARTSLASFILIPLIYLLWNEVVRHKARLPSFPGPRGLPVIGNFADIRYNAAERYRQCTKAYGQVYQIQLGNILVVVVNPAEAA